ncbi:uncharacterized protein LOC128182245 [Crassostrea angulata]|uniref:uncharacterized protein LOC128182245 n=1 Tax=Magallana angulata TaxID=2784310 RepID=UPI0022B1F44F|nr:uncharacterized protein LOC128182245 [Crassostrea angulata]
MVDAIIKRYIALISTAILLRHKGLAQGQICSESIATPHVVQKCPMNREEWERASQKKKCSEIQKYDNCRNVEYHCLVNEFRNETIEVCTDPWYLQGYCPIYLENGVKNDYTKMCMNKAYPCNCSNQYRSTEAYKWQCCFNEKFSSGKWNITVTDSDKYSNLNTLIVAVWVLLAIILLLMVLCAFGFVYQRRLECIGKPEEVSTSLNDFLLFIIKKCLRYLFAHFELYSFSYLFNNKYDNFGKRVRDLVKSLDNLKKVMDQIIGNDIFDLEYKLRSTEMKLDNMYKKLFGSTGKPEPPLTKASALEARVTKTSTIIKKMHQKLRDLNLDFIDDDLKHHVSKRPNSHDIHITEPNDVTEGVAVEFYNKTTSNKPLEFSTEENGDYKYGDSSLCHMMPDGENNQNKEEDCIQMSVSQQTRLSKKIMPDNTSGYFLTDECGPLFEKKTLREKMEYLRDNTDKLMENFKKVRDAYYEKDKPGNLHTLDYQLTDTEADVDVLADVYGFKEIQGSRSGKCLEENLEEMNSLFEKLSEKFEQMERKVGKP